MKNILIVDDHFVVRCGLKQILSRLPGIEVLAESSEGKGILRRLQETPMDLVLLDLNLPDRDGIEVLKDIRSEFPDLPVLVLSIHTEVQFAERALKAGANGYLTKDSAGEELLDAVGKVMSGIQYLGSAITETLERHASCGRDRPPHERLSDREHQVMLALVKGRTNKEISHELSLSDKTVSTYRRRILDKLDLASTAELVKYAMQHLLT